MRETAKIFTNGGSQAVRLPAEFRFDAEEIYIWRDEYTGDVILSARPRARWADFANLRNRLHAVPDDFLADRRQPSEGRDPFDPAR
jgi:antitoxin VapB